MGRVQVFPRQARSILTRTGGYLEGFTHTLQPYVGCGFSCLYCYVRELMVQRANRHRLPWSHWLEPKLNAPELLGPTLQFDRRPTLLAAGQLVGTEGYTAAVAGGWLAGTNAARLAAEIISARATSSW